MPEDAPKFFVIEIETGHALREWETQAEAHASVAFARIEADVPKMSALTSR